MSTLVGRPLRAAVPVRPVLARAALLSDENGPPALAPDLLVQAARRARYSAEGPLEVILVARRFADARAVRYSGLSVVGIVAEEDEEKDTAGGDPGAGPAILVGVAGARDAITEGDLLIVDGARGRVLVQPDAVAIARVQTEPDPPRLLLGAAHTPARTLSGRLVPVWATVAPPGDLDAALEAGADGLLLPRATLDDLIGSTNVEPDDSPFTVPPSPSDALLAVVDAVGGGDVVLQTDGMRTLDPVHLTQIGARCNLLWLLDPAEVPLAPGDLRKELCALAADEEDQGRPARAPRLAALIHAGAPAATNTGTALLLAGFDEVIVFVEDARDAAPALLDEVFAAAAAERAAGDTPPPLRVWLADPDNESGDLDVDAWLNVLVDLVTRGASGVIVPPRHVGAVKDRIRTAE